MKVLFVYPDFHVKRSRSGHVSYETAGWYTEGLASLSATLKKHGHQTALLQLLWPPTKQEFQNDLERLQPDLVALTLRSEVFRVGTDFALWAKEAGYPTIVGSYHPTLDPQEAIAALGIDIVCLGEGEVPLAELCDRMQKGEDHFDIPGLWLKRDGEIVRNPAGPVVENLDDLPIPDFSLFDFTRLESSRTFTALASLTRGCPYNCSYCANYKLRAIYPNKRHWLRTRSPGNSIEYLRALKATYPEARYLRIMDDIFHYREDWLEEFVPLYKAEFDMPMAVNHRPNLFTKRQAELLKDAGCYQVYFGVESGNERIRNDVLQRHMSNEEIKRAFAYAHDAGMVTLAYNMIGLPRESMSDALDTIKLNAEIGANRILNPVFYLLPDTDLYDMARKERFCPPHISYEEEVGCSMPGYRSDQIKFVSANFKLFVRLYRIAYSLPDFVRLRVERTIDRVFLWPLLPYRLLTWLAKARQGSMDKLKAVVRERTPGVYIFVRDRLVGNRL
jgi:anaerobic magnesium-protoporphyrin IX monomethyl ester cyclase